MRRWRIGMRVLMRVGRQPGSKRGVRPDGGMKSLLHQRIGGVYCSIVRVVFPRFFLHDNGHLRHGVASPMAAEPRRVLFCATSSRCPGLNGL